MPLILVASALAAVPPDRLSTLERSIFRVECPADGRTASGFAWGGGESVVTALHVVNGCAQVKVTSSPRQDSRAATVARILPGRDLALLELASSPSAWSAPPLTPRAQAAAVGLAVTVFGHVAGIPQARAAELKVAYAGQTIQRLLPADLFDTRGRLRGSDWIDTAAAVIPFTSGSIAPGDSGAPILDDTGAVVAIADGGLERGAVELAWGIPAAALASLAASTSSSMPSTHSSLATFAAEVRPIGAANTAVEVSCGGGSFVRIRDRSLDEIAATADDALGLVQMIVTFATPVMGVAVPAHEIEAMRFGVWRDVQSGATVVVPADLTLTPNGMSCGWGWPEQGLVARAREVSVAGLAGAQDESVRFENELVAGRVSMIDGGFTYPEVRQGWNGLAVRRKAAFLGTTATPAGAAPTAWAFETLASRDNAFLGVAVEKGGLDVDIGCLLGWGAGHPACPTFPARYGRLASLVFGVHLSSFSLG